MTVATLLLRCAGIMQSWGTRSRFTIRETGLEPSKSGVVGILCAAMGRPRSDDLKDLASLLMGIRVDFPGTVLVDYQTAKGVALAKGGKDTTNVQSRRYYLADADFLVGLEGESGLLEHIYQALKSPVWAVSLGRKSYLPLVPLWIPDGMSERGLEASLAEYPWPRIGKQVPDDKPETLRFIIETTPREGEETRRDQPVGAAYGERSFALRHVTARFYKLGEEIPIRGDT